MITVLVPRRATQVEAALQAEQVDSDTAVGVRVLRNGKATVVARWNPHGWSGQGG
jgi:hypothetical protein